MNDPKKLQSIPIVRGDAVLAELETMNLYTWLEIEAVKRGTASQIERYVDDMLPEDELTALARAELFKPLDAFKRWGTSRAREAMTRELAHEVRHHDLFRRKQEGPRELAYETTEAIEVSEEEHQRLKAIRDAIGLVRQHPWIIRSSARVAHETLSHWVTCHECKAEVCRSFVKVSIEWAGRVLVREYAL